MQPKVTLLHPANASDILILILLLFIEKTVPKLKNSTVHGIRGAEKKRLTFENYPKSKFGDLTQQIQEAVGNIAMLYSGNDGVRPIIDYCFFEGGDLAKLRAHEITHGRKLLKLSERDLREIGVSSKSTDEFVSFLTAHCFQLPTKSYFS